MAPKTGAAGSAWKAGATGAPSGVPTPATVLGPLKERPHWGQNRASLPCRAPHRGQALRPGMKSSVYGVDCEGLLDGAHLAVERFDGGDLPGDQFLVGALEAVLVEHQAPEIPVSELADLAQVAQPPPEPTPLTKSRPRRGCRLRMGRLGSRAFPLVWRPFRGWGLRRFARLRGYRGNAALPGLPGRRFERRGDEGLVFRNPGPGHGGPVDEGGHVVLGRSLVAGGRFARDGCLLSGGVVLLAAEAVSESHFPGCPARPPPGDDDGRRV